MVRDGERDASLCDGVSAAVGVAAAAAVCVAAAAAVCIAAAAAVCIAIAARAGAVAFSRAGVAVAVAASCVAGAGQPARLVLALLPDGVSEPRQLLCAAVWVEA